MLVSAKVVSTSSVVVIARLLYLPLGVINGALDMVLPEYLSDVAKDMRTKSAAIRRDFAPHHLSAGENREDLVADFLTNHLPRRFGVNSGIEKIGVAS